ncbi:MAG: DNA polymerase III subunit epsilon, partial [Mariprofundaceae bacterium]|nr:DNA polymerase III subunit epsilon [Mariprofundaceae bacterium]
DRRMMERRFPQVKEVAWACTFADLAWQEEGIASRKLDYIAYQMNFFFDGHRAVNDAQATLHLLAQGLPKSKKYAMGELLRHARKSKVRIFALAAPFDKKDELKARGYRWLADFLNKNGKKGVWSLLIEESAREAEETWLRDEIYSQKEPMFQCKILTAKDRYSLREFALS